MNQTRTRSFAATIFLSFAAFALIPTLASIPANHTSDLRYRKLNITHSEQGAQIKLFGMMPEMELTAQQEALRVWESVNQPGESP